VGDCFQQALNVARRQEAKALELRAALSLSRLWQRRGQRIEARLMLTEVYSGITEGFDTADLKEAKALIEELSSSCLASSHGTRVSSPDDFLHRQEDR
jgi:predicted ATPase